MWLGRTPNLGGRAQHKAWRRRQWIGGNGGDPRRGGRRRRDPEHPPPRQQSRAALTEKGTVDNTDDPEKLREDLMNIAKTTLSSKVVHQEKEYFAGLCVAWMLTQGGQGGRPAPLASRLHTIPTHFLLNLHRV